MRDRLEVRGAKVEMRLDARQVLKDELLRARFVDLTLSEADDLQLVHVAISVLFGSPI